MAAISKLSFFAISLLILAKRSLLENESVVSKECPGCNSDFPYLQPPPGFRMTKIVENFVTHLLILFLSVSQGFGVFNYVLNWHAPSRKPH